MGEGIGRGGGRVPPYGDIGLRIIYGWQAGGTHPTQMFSCYHNG